MKKKGFTLIELVVVVAIILLLASTLAPKLRKEVAKARDAKAVAALGSLRTAVNIFYADDGSAPTDLEGSGNLFTYGVTTSEYLETNLISYLEEESESGTTTAPIGGHRDAAAGTLTYGGTIDYVYSSGDLEVSLVEDADDGDDYDTKGNAWASY
jgi:prepilin-type N-terminal cleavage/methylation domain-containing protein